MALVEKTGLTLDLLIDIGGTNTVIGGRRDCSLTINSDTVDASHAGNAGWNVNLVGQRSWEFSGTFVMLLNDASPYGLDPGQEEARDNIMSGTTVTVRQEFPTSGGSDAALYGTAVITSVEISGSFDDVIEYSISGTGAGTLTWDAPEPS